MKSLLIGFLVLISVTGSTQQPVSPIQNSYLHNYNIIQRLASRQSSRQPDIIPGIPAPEPEVQGDYYIHPDYRIATFLLYADDRLVEGYAARFDLHSNEFDLLTSQGVRALPGNQVRSVVWLDSVSMQPHYLVNAREFINEAQVPHVGFFEILCRGNMMLLRKTEIEVKTPDYHPALNVGSRDFRILKKSSLYYTAGNQALLWPGKKQGMKLFSSKALEVSEYIKLNALDLNKEGHLRALIDYYNFLTE